MLARNLWLGLTCMVLCSTPALAHPHVVIEGWSDVVLVDKDELTSGSTWLAAGNVPQYSKSYDGTRIHNYPVELYPTLQEETGQDTGWLDEKHHS